MILHKKMQLTRTCFSLLRNSYYNYILLQAESYDNTFHGSWLAIRQTGIIVMPILMKNGEETGTQSDKRNTEATSFPADLSWCNPWKTREAYQTYLNQQKNHTCVGNRLYIGNPVIAITCSPDRSTLQALLDKSL